MKKNTFRALSIMLILSSCGSGEEKKVDSVSSKNETPSEQKNVVSNEEKIGSQIWMTENLSVDKFRNGDPIPEAKTAEEWERAGKNKQPAWCSYNNDANNISKYGKLYNWYAVNDSRGLAPKGWHIPSDKEWNLLSNAADSNSVAVGLKSPNGWKNKANGSNSTGFNAIPGGFRFFVGGFGYEGEYAAFWSSTTYNSLRSFHRYLNQSNKVNRDQDGFDNGGGCSVRCIKD
jgi:uncharacterized protein (TIGR02145 family)